MYDCAPVAHPLAPASAVAPHPWHQLLHLFTSIQPFSPLHRTRSRSSNIPNPPPLCLTSKMTLALSSPPSNNVAMVAIADSASKHGSAYNINLIVVHVILGAVATMLFLPSGIVIPRYARGLVTARWWFPLHLAVQGLGAVAGLGALGTAFSLGGAGGSAHQVCTTCLTWNSR